MIRQDSISIALTAMCVAISFYLSTFDLGVLALYPALLAISGLVLQQYLQRRLEYDDEINATDRAIIIKYVALGVVVLGISAWVSPRIFTFSAVGGLSIIDRQLYAVMMAVAEEQMFRGFFTTFFVSRWGPTGIIASAGVFTVYHFAVYGTTVANLGFVLLAGVMFSWIAWKTGRVSVPQIVHIINNMVAAA